MIEIRIIDIVKPDDLNVIIGQTHFIKTVEDMHEAIVSAVPNIKFGLAFCEASGARLIRWTGNDEKLIELAQKNAEKIGAGHSFILFIKDAFPINILNPIKNLPEVCGIYCATANPVQLLVASTTQGSGILGVIDGQPPVGIEDEEGIAWRKNLLRDIGYKVK